MRRALVLLSVTWLAITGCASESDAEAFAADVHAAVRFLEEVRGLELPEAVPVRVVTSEDMAARFAPPALDPETLGGWFAIQRALGFAIPDGYAETLTAGSLPAGLYAPEYGEILLDENWVGNDDQLVLVHELTHAAQDQAYGLWFGSPRAGASLGWLSLVEGDADWVAYQHPDSERVASVEDDELDIVEELLPLDLLEIATPYVLGPGLVDALVERGGLALLDAAYDRPPRALSEVIWTSRYDPTVPRAALGSAGESFDVLAWAVLLDPHGDPADIWDLLGAFRHERYLVDDRDGDGPLCLTVEVGLDTGADTGTLRRWATARSATFEQLDDGVEIEGVCDDTEPTLGVDPETLDRVLFTALAVQFADATDPSCEAAVVAEAVAAVHLVDPTSETLIPDAVADALGRCADDRQ
jgi:hypothetical protein